MGAELEALLKSLDSLCLQPTQAVEALHPVTAAFNLHRHGQPQIYTTDSSNVEGHAQQQC